ncbi:methyl-accepting chemotaxis protein [Ectopseudomonas composti]|uniref:methyl-accepting chemotaxis protein n=1 Tax=Ectopseudomonas composti TaxID=658457 RepID=UPI0007734360|nr:methyl-accepting chemotaxis protein [Pseudomonas composti]
MLKNAPLSVKLLLILIFPLLGFLAFSGMYLAGKYQTLSEMNRTLTASATAQKISILVTALQRERGASGVFLGSKGTAMADALKQFRLDSDTAARQMQTLSADATAGLEQVLQDLETISALREQVDKQAINSGESGARYTDLIKALIGYTHSLEASISAPQILRALGALNQFVEMKERAGRERALLGVAFTQNQISADLLSRLSRNLGEFSAYQDAFQRRAEADIKRKLDEALQQPAAQAASDMQRKALETPLGEALNTKAEDWFKHSTARIDLMLQVENELGQNVGLLASRAHEEAKHGLWLTIAIILGVLTAVVVLSFLIIRNIKSAVSDVNDTLVALSKRDLTAHTHYTGRDEFGVIAHNLDNMTQQIREVIQAIGGATAQVASAAEHSSTVALQTSQHVAQQRQGTDQVATAINEMSATVRDVARSTTEAAEMSRRVNDDTLLGKTEIENTVRLVQALSTQAEQTAQIILELKNESDAISSVLDVIRGVAEQTNLLALNAAIEAARAGEQGRGFAVVADEVRQLAQKTQDSTVSIQQMISNLQSGSDRAASSMQETLNKAHAGASNVVKAGELLEQIADGIASISDRNIQVASAAEEQSLVSEEINRNVNDINDLVIQVSAAAEETALNSRELAGLADHQQQLVGRFKVA